MAAAPLEPRAAHKHHHSPDAEDQQRAREVRFQQHQHSHRAQHQREGQHPDRKTLHSIVVQRNDVREHQHHRKLRDLAGLQRAQAGEHDPALAAVVFRHEQHHHQPGQRHGEDGPRQLVEDVIIHPAGHAHGRQPQRRVQQLRADISVGVVAAIQRHGIAGAVQHDQPKAHQREHQQQKWQVGRALRAHSGRVACLGVGGRGRHAACRRLFLHIFLHVFLHVWGLPAPRFSPRHSYSTRKGHGLVIRAATERMLSRSGGFFAARYFKTIK
jgi:hypothetical protein